PSLAFACYFVAFFLAGVWHGTTPNFAVFGIIHGLGASTNKIWELLITRRRGRSGLRRYLESRPIPYAAVFATAHYVCFSFLFFSAGVEESLVPLRLLGSALAPGGWAR